MSKTALRNMLTHEEGCELSAYLDTEGNWTIGYGHLLGGQSPANDALYSHLSWAQDQAEQELDKEIEDTLDRCASSFPFYSSLSEARQEVIAAMAYQLGTQGVFKFSGMISAITAANWQDATFEMLDSEWQMQTPGRARRMAIQFLSDQRWDYDKNPIKKLVHP